MNTFYFDAPLSPGADDQTIIDALENFYTTDPGSGFVLGAYINDTILRTEGLRIDLVLSPESVPNAVYESQVFDLPSANGNPLPQETAGCVSFVSAAYQSSLTPGRERGRVYIGPLTVNAGDGGGGLLTPLRLGTQFQNTLAQAAGALANETDTQGVFWSIWSRADAAFHHVSSGWVDNEFDTQRRRGWDPTGKVFWFG